MTESRYLPPEIDSALAAGRDAATIYRSNAASDTCKAANLAQRLINDQCPEYFSSYAVDAFNSNTGSEVTAVLSQSQHKPGKITIFTSPMPTPGADSLRPLLASFTY